MRGLDDSLTARKFRGECGLRRFDNASGIIVKALPETFEVRDEIHQFRTGIAIAELRRGMRRREHFPEHSGCDINRSHLNMVELVSSLLCGVSDGNTGVAETIDVSKKRSFADAGGLLEGIPVIP